MFDQTESSNWFHPLGFAYEPDGAHEGVDELEDGIGNSKLVWSASVYLLFSALAELQNVADTNSK